VPFDPNDPRLTAYALGELDEPELADVEAQLAACPESRRAVAEVRAAAALLTEELRREPAPGLAAELLGVIEGRLQPSQPPRIRLWARRLAAACVLLALCGLAYDWLRPRHPTDALAYGWLRPHHPPESDTTKLNRGERGLTKWGESAPQDRESRMDGSFENKPDPAHTTLAEDELSSQVADARKPLPAGAKPAEPRFDLRQLTEKGVKVSKDGERFASINGSATAEASRRSKTEGANADGISNMMGDGMGGMGGGMRGMKERGFVENVNPVRDHTYGNREGLMGVPGDVRGDQRGTRFREGEVVLKGKLELADAPHSHDDDFDATRIAEQPQAGVGGEQFNPISDNPFLQTRQAPLSTFSVDVDTASYANMRRFLTQGAMPPRDSVRIEELVNYFPYSYPQPAGDEPFSINVELARCPWDPAHRLARIGLKGREIATDKRPPSNLVFLVDVSGSMAQPNKLPLVQASLRLLLEKLGEGDRVALVVYAGNSGLVMPSTSCSRKDEIAAAIDRLQAGGSTNGGQGIQLAYDVATANLLPGGTNRVILCTDGDFNVGIVDQGDLVKLIEQKAKRKVFLSVLGFGMGNLKDGMMEQLADKGDGNYAYIDTMLEARKVLSEQMSGTLVTIAKDVKIQVEFNPARVASYRLIGYENRMLRKEDFNDDTKDAGEIGAGHAVTALYELVPAGADAAAVPAPAPDVDPLEFQQPKPAPAPVAEAAPASPLALMVKLRYKPPEGDTSKLLKRGIEDEGRDLARASDDFKFAASVAAFGMILRDSPHKGNATLNSVLELGESSKNPDPSGYRAEFLDLVRRARTISGR